MVFVPWSNNCNAVVIQKHKAISKISILTALIPVKRNQQTPFFIEPMKRISFALSSAVSRAFWGIIDLIDNPIAIGFALALSIIPIYYYFILPFLSRLGLRDDDYKNIQQLIEWFGVPYALLLALVLVNVWKQFDETDRAFDREADAILALYNTFLLVSNKRLEKDVATNMIGYIKHVKDYYSEECEDKKSHYRNIGDEFLNQIRKLIGDLIKKRGNKVLTAELLRLVNELIDDRGDRLAYSKQRMPKPVLFLSLIASFLWLAPFFVLKFSDFFVGIFLVAGVTLVVVSIILIVWDLDNPFGGTWVIHLDSWEELLNKIK